MNIDELIQDATDFHNKPCAAPGLTSFRYAGLYGFVMIGAKNASEALGEAARSITGEPDLSRLQVWDATAGEYVSIA